MPSTIDSALTRDGLRLVTRHWAVPDGGSPRSAVLLVHGVGEHAGRYEHVGDQLAEAGHETFGWDLRGFGASDGERAYVDSFESLQDDVEDRLAAMRAAVPGVPAVLYGHSLGGLIALSCVLDGRAKPDLLVLSAPGLDDDLARWKHRVAPILGRVAPHLRIPNGLTAEMLAADPARQAAVASDPLVLRASTARFGALCFDQQASVRGRIDALSIPTLVIHGLDDPVVPARSSEALAELPVVTRRTYPGIRHELHNEAAGPAIIADVIRWIDDHLVPVSPVASG